MRKIDEKSLFKVLIIRRDNIGDLLSVTPSIRALREKYPNIYIVVFANTYNSPILKNNPDIDKVEVYKKAKHRETGESLFSVYSGKLKTIFRLREEKFDYAIIASSNERVREWNLAKWCKPKCIIGYVGKNIKPKPFDIGLELSSQFQHEVEYVFNLFSVLNVKPPIPSMQLFADQIYRNKSSELEKHTVIGIHISARKIKQRWPVENFAKFIIEIEDKFGVNFLIFWSPGAKDHPTHPGDDDKANELLKLCKNLPVKLYQTKNLRELVNGMSLCNYVICSDGGGMHVAAALGKPIVCLFGNSDAKHWHPWGVTYELLQSESNDVIDISVNDVVLAFKKIYEQGK